MNVVRDEDAPFRHYPPQSRGQEPEVADAPWTWHMPISDFPLGCRDSVWEAGGVSGAKLPSYARVQERVELPRCAGCHRVIKDERVFEVMNKSWHCACLKCACCFRQLKHQCHVTPTGQLICERDFNRLSHMTCAGCDAILPRNIEVHRVHGNVYHKYCFTCLKCKNQLKAGDKLYLRFDNKIECKECFDSKFT